MIPEHVRRLAAVAPPVVSTGCARCRTALDDVPFEDVGAGSRLLYGFGEVMNGRRCPHCGWASRDDARHEIRFGLLARSLPQLGLTFPDADRPEEIEVVLRTARARVTGTLRELVARSPKVALAWVLSCATEVGGDLTVMEDKLVGGLQQVYAALLARGPLPVFAQLPSVPDAWYERVTPLVLGNALIAGVLRELPLGTFDRPRLRSGTFDADLSARARWAFDVDLNAAGVPAEDPLDASHRAADLEREVFGVAVTDLLAMVSVPGVLDDVTRVRREGGLIMVDLAGDVPVVQAIRDRLVLSRGRWAAHRTPSFFHLDERPAGRADQALVIAAAELDWLRYQPLLQVGYVHDGVLHPAAVTTPGLLERSAARARGSIAGRMQRAEAVARRSGGDTARRVCAMVRSVHAEFEDGAARACRAGGLLAVQGVERLAGRPLPCGEIDVFAMGESPEGPVAVVIECKNVDTTFFEDSGPDQAGSTIERAAAQAERKAVWVEDNWPLVARELAWTSRRPVVVRLVVTRRAAFPAPPQGIAVVPLRELRDTVEDLVTSPRERWWPVFRGE